MLTIYGSARTRALRCIWVLEELQIPYELKSISPHAGEHLTDEFRAINPCTKVPALTDDDVVLFESAAIANYVVARYQPESSLVPKDPKSRGLYDQWMFYTMAELEQPLWTIAKHTFALKESVRIPEVIPTAKYEWHKAQKIIGKHLELTKNSFLLGPDFTVADIFVAHTFMWAKMLNLPSDSSIIKDYLGRCRESKGYARLKEKYL